jgi:flagellum-specific ATP synthase
MMARYTKADINVIALVGERGREVVEFMERDLGPEGMARSVLVVATSDKSPLIRMRAAYAATAVAEFFRDQGKDVLLMMDSVTRFAMAGREVGLAAGEPPTRGGYTPSVFAHLPQLLERAGKSAKGSITGIYTVLVDGDDFTEPIADSTRSILDGHIVLTRELADLGHYPAIDVLRSISRLRSDITTPQVQADGRTMLRHMATFKRVEDMVNIGAYQKGANAEVDKAISMVAPINGFLRQLVTEREPLEGAFAKLHALTGDDAAQQTQQPKQPQNAPRQAKPPQPKRVPPPPSSIPVTRK